jgi:hypothetical protein
MKSQKVLFNIEAMENSLVVLHLLGKKQEI